MMNYGGVAAMSGVPGYMPAMYTMQQVIIIGARLVIPAVQFGYTLL